MKIRNGHISNSSSSSFVLIVVNKTNEEKDYFDFIEESLKILVLRYKEYLINNFDKHIPCEFCKKVEDFEKWVWETSKLESVSIPPKEIVNIGYFTIMDNGEDETDAFREYEELEEKDYKKFGISLLRFIINTVFESLGETYCSESFIIKFMGREGD